MTKARQVGQASRATPSLHSLSQSACALFTVRWGRLAIAGVVGVAGNLDYWSVGIIRFNENTINHKQI